MEMGPYTIARSPDAFRLALKQCRGAYQRNLIRGHDDVGCVTIACYPAHLISSYVQSKNGLLERMTEAGIVWMIRLDQYDRNILVLDGIGRR